MAKQATKKDRQAALRQKHTAAPFSAPELPPTTPGDNDPPIIVSGGSVTITSKVFLSVNYDERTRRFVYFTDEVSIKRIKTRGKKDQEDATDGGRFEIELRED